MAAHVARVGGQYRPLDLHREALQIDEHFKADSAIGRDIFVAVEADAAPAVRPTGLAAWLGQRPLTRVFVEPFARRRFAFGAFF